MKKKEKKSCYQIQAQKIAKIPTLKSQLTLFEKKTIGSSKRNIDIIEQLNRGKKKYEALILKNTFENSSIYKRFHEASCEDNSTKINKRRLGHFKTRN